MLVFHLYQKEIGAGGIYGKARDFHQFVEEAVSFLYNVIPHFKDFIPVFQHNGCKELGEGVQVVGRLDFADGVDDFFIGHQVAAAHARQAEGFGQGTEHHQVRIFTDKGHHAFFLGEFHVRFVHENQVVRRLQHFFDEGRRQEVAGGVVRIADYRHFRLVFLHGIKQPFLVAAVACQVPHLDGGGAQGFRSQFVHVEGGRMNEKGVAGVHEGAQEVGNHFIAAVAADNVFRPCTDVVSQSFPKAIGHGFRVNLGFESVQRFDQFLLYRRNGKHIEIVFIGINDVFLRNGSHEVGFKILNRISQPFSLHPAPP